MKPAALMPFDVSKSISFNASIIPPVVDVSITLFGYLNKAQRGASPSLSGRRQITVPATLSPCLRELMISLLPSFPAPDICQRIKRISRKTGKGRGAPDGFLVNASLFSCRAGEPSMRWYPKPAIIAALSVQNFGGAA